MPDCLLTLFAHVLSWDVTIERWSKGDLTQNWSGVPHPGQVLHEYALSSFIQLKDKQQELLISTAAGQIRPWTKSRTRD
jgi:hypothetical protein